MIRGRLATLYRRLYPAGLGSEWFTVLKAADMTNYRLDPKHKPIPDGELLKMAREAAATGKRPGDVLAQMLTELYGRAA